MTADDLREKVARWLCEFAKLDPDEPIADTGHTAVDWFAYHDVPRLLALMDGREGWKLVPVEPTEAMIEAGFGPFLGAHDPAFSANEPCGPIYRAMLAASPGEGQTP